MNPDKRLYSDFSRYLKKKYGEKVSRIPVDTGLGCPNREKGRPGCIYCLKGSASPASESHKSVFDQIETYRNKALSKKKPVKKFIAYFQAYTNTYAKSSTLFNIFSQVNIFPDIVAAAIGTRPDCITHNKLTNIRKALEEKDIWIEYGLQSVNRKTLQFINRGHGTKAFQTAVEMTRKFDIKTGAHVILGFPWEKEKDILRLARFLSLCKIDFLKIHILHVLKDTPLEILYRKKKITLPSYDRYLHLSALLLEHLPKDIVIQRLTGEGTKETHIAPAWALEKTKVIEGINSELKKKNSFQGKFA